MKNYAIKLNPKQAILLDCGNVFVFNAPKGSDLVKGLIVSPVQYWQRLKPKKRLTKEERQYQMKGHAADHMYEWSR